jgi:putative serine protease PepD
MSPINRYLPILLGAIAGGVIALIVATSASSTKSVTTTVVQSSGGSSIPSSLTNNKGLSINQIFKTAGPGVVDIDVTSQTTSPGFGFFGGGGTQEQEGEGAGVVYNTKGYILTDEHVVANATSVTVHFEDGYHAPATVVGTDPSTDVAVIHVNAPASELHPIAFANSSAAEVGDPVVAIGSPFSLPETVTAGIVSATGRPIQAPNGYSIPGAIQTDAAINPGNSGGPLLDANGQVLGLNDQIETNSGSNAGVGFAIPGNTVVKIANQIMGGQKPEHAYVGVYLNSTSTGGARISSVSSGSPAATAGLRTNDLITAINGTAVNSTEQFIDLINDYRPGQAVTFTVKRGSAALKIKVTLGTRPATSPSAG